MKTINFLTAHFLPEISPCTNRVLPFIMELQKSYKVNVICITEKGKYQEHEKVIYNDNVIFYYVNQEDFNGRNFYIRGWYELFYAFKLIQLSNKLKCDATFVTSPYMFLIPLAGYGIKGKKVLDNRDLVWEYLEENSFVKKAIKKMLKIIMKQSIKRFDDVLVTNDYEYRILTDEYDIEDVIIVPNGIAQERYDGLSAIKKSTDIPITVTYVGNIGLAQNIQILVEAARELPDVRFLIIGDGLDLPSIKKYVYSNQLENVVFTGKVEWDELAYHYSNTSVLYAQLDEKYSAAMPSKLYEYASIGLPIIYGGMGQAVSFIEKLEHAKVVQPNNVEELVHAIDAMQNNAGTISKKNRLLVKERYIREESSKIVAQTVSKHID